ncbi:MAG TPA: aminopeptidase P family protein [Papillibacter sp.]|jgi:Xaa-Pro aminopeptidase|nr:aminopeptidase P family protein [Papillibacter sp.]
MDTVSKIRAQLQETNLDALLVTSAANRRYVTGFPSSAGALFITRSRAVFMTDSRYIEAAQRAVKSAEVRPVTAKDTYSSHIKQIMEEENVAAVGFEEESMTYSEYQTWTQKIGDVLRPAQKILTNLRAAKSREELGALRAAQTIAEEAFYSILPMISTKITERELATELIYRLLRCGADDISFEPIVVSGIRSSMPHGVPGDDRIQKGFLTIDFGAKKNGWCSDTTRTLCVGEPTKEMRKVYDTVLSAQKAGIAAARAGIPGCDVDAAARRVIEAAGYGDYFGHGFGHGLGLDVHEGPNLSPSNKEPLPVGAVVSAEPGIYIPGRFGVRIEDVLYLTEDGCENITTLPKHLVIV